MSTIIIPNFNTAKEVNGLNTYTFTVTSAGMHVARIRTNRHASSTISMAIQLNGSPVVSKTMPVLIAGSPQSSDNILATMNCAVSDVISFVLSSSSSADQQLNSTQSIINVTRGSGN